MNNQNEVTMYHVNDIRILDHLFGNPVPTQAPPEKGKACIKRRLRRPY